MQMPNIYAPCLNKANLLSKEKPGPNTYNMPTGTSVLGRKKNPCHQNWKPTIRHAVLEGKIIIVLGSG